jgi:hypothetical protein
VHMSGIAIMQLHPASGCMDGICKTHARSERLASGQQASAAVAGLTTWMRLQQRHDGALGRSPRPGSGGSGGGRPFAAPAA